MNCGFYSKDELEGLPFGSLGHNVQISRSANFYGMERMDIGDNVRIDDFSLISGRVTIGSYVHVASYVGLHGRFGITLDDFSGVSSKSTLFSGSDDYSGFHLTNPTVPEEYTSIDGRPIILKRHALLGANTIVLPGVTVGEGAATGAFSLVSRDLEPWTIYGGVPCKPIKARSKKLLDLEKLLNGRTQL